MFKLIKLTAPAHSLIFHGGDSTLFTPINRSGKITVIQISITEGRRGGFVGIDTITHRSANGHIEPKTSRSEFFKRQIGEFVDCHDESRGRVGVVLSNSSNVILKDAKTFGLLERIIYVVFVVAGKPLVECF